MKFSERIQKSFGLFGRDDPNAKYGVFRILGEDSKLVTTGSKDSCENTRNKLASEQSAKTPKFVVRKLTNLWSFGEEFDSSEVETKWVPPEDLFAEGSADKIAKEVYNSHDSLKSAIACLNFYLNRGGDNIPDDRKKVIEDAKEKIRGMYNKNFSSFDQLDLLMNGKGINVVKVERLPPNDNIIPIPYWRYYFYLNDTFALGFYFKDGKWNCNTRVPDTKCPEKAEILKILTEKYPNGIAENKNFSLKYKKVVLNIIDQDGEIMRLLEFISTNSLAGHSFDVVVDPGSTDNERTFFIDGDGSDKLRIE